MPISLSFAPKPVQPSQGRGGRRPPLSLFPAYSVIVPSRKQPKPNPPKCANHCFRPQACPAFAGARRATIKPLSLAGMLSFAPKAPPAFAHGAEGHHQTSVPGWHFVICHSVCPTFAGARGAPPPETLGRTPHTKNSIVKDQCCNQLKLPRH